MPEPPKIFISYSHADRRWKDRLVRQLEVLQFEKKLLVWDDSQIAAGDDWLPEIEAALDTAEAAVLLISPSFLTSQFIRGVEVPRLFQRRASNRIRVFPLLVEPCPWKKVDWLSRLQCRPVGGQVLSTMTRPVAEESLAALVEEIDDLLRPDRVRGLPDGETHYLQRQLEEARLREEEIVSRGEDASEVRAEILELRRRIREGEKLRKGMLLARRFKLLEKIGRGGFSTVWKALDRKSRGLVALKVLHGQYAEDPGRRERFFRGARQMGQLQHQHIARVIEQECRDGSHHFFVMEYAAGGDLRQALLEGQLAQDEAWRILLETGEGLAFAHERGLTHRDVKPANILLDEAGRARLTDFDLVRAADTTGGTRTGMLGTFLYAAPELMSSPQDAGVAADVYGLGMTALFVLAGRDLPLEVLREGPAFLDRLEVRAGVRAAIERAIAWKPEERWDSVTGLCRALAEGLREEDGEAPEPIARETVPSPRPAPVSPRARRRSPSDEDLFQWIETPKDGRIELWHEIPAGTGWIGSQKGVGRDNERPRHQIEIVRPFRLSAVPVTNAMYAAFDPDREWVRWEGVSEEELAFHPVVNVTWDQAMAFCRWLAETFPWARGARLPTEEEWEYACRAGTETAYWKGDGEPALAEVGWYDANSEGRTHRVGEKGANPWGLYDVHGNVWEWTANMWDEKRYSGREKAGITVDPAEEPADFAADPGAGRVVRGGCCWNDAGGARSAYRLWNDPGWVRGNLGFRVLVPGAPSGRA